VNSLVVSAGEALRAQDLPDAPYSVQRTYREIDLEVFYFNNTTPGGQGNCDRTPPDLAGGFAAGAYHQVLGDRIEWAVNASDGGDPAAVWRVLVVSTLNADGDAIGAWEPLELENDGSGTWRGSRSMEGSRVTYVIQAVDRRGNVAWVDYVTSPAGLPASGVPHGIPLTVEVEPVRQTRHGDFDADGRSDQAVYQASTGTWSVRGSDTGSVFQVQLGNAASIPVIGDFDGDGTADPAVYNRGHWRILLSTTGAVVEHRVGNRLAVPVPADYDGDAKTDVAAFQPGLGTWTIRASRTGETMRRRLGGAASTPQPGDYDGDGKADVAVFEAGTWRIRRSSDNVIATLALGASGDAAVARDYDGDGLADPAVFRPSTATWLVEQSTNGLTATHVFGAAGDRAVPADYDGDGLADLAVYTPATGQWSIRSSATGAITITSLGGAGFVPVT
jgi:hypothetical protein